MWIGGSDPETVQQEIAKLGVVPVSVIEYAQQAPRLGRALLEGGLPCAEITFRTAAAEESIRRLAEEVPELLIGAGTVLTPKQAEKTVAAGANFVVAPGFNPRVVDQCRHFDVAVFPGICTPTEIEAALEKGIRTLNFSPAEAMGGLSYLKSIAAPYGEVRFIPTGGVNPENAGNHLAFPKVLAVGGTWLAPRPWLMRQRFDRIREAAHRAVQIVSQVRKGQE